MTATPLPVSRVLDWDGCLNVRDVGGLHTADGRLTRHGALVRSDMLCRLTPAGQQALLDHGIRTIIDLRTPNELARDGDGYAWRLGHSARAAGLRYRHLSFTAGLDDSAWSRMQDSYATAGSREELNRLDLTHHASSIAAVVAAITESPPGGVAVHCHAGKDRTGLVVALCLSVAGVLEDEIADDYALTALNLERLIVDWLHQMSSDPDEHERLRRLSVPRREAMLDTLAFLRASFGSAEEYLIAQGLSERQLAGLRGRLVGS
jgi:protein-tyrosine phosphatase